MRLRIFNAIRAAVLDHVFPKNYPLKGSTYIKADAMDEPSYAPITPNYRTRFFLELGCIVEVHDPATSRPRAAELLCRELFKELTEELYALEDYVFSEGYPRDVTDKINRIRRLSQGEDVEAIE